MLDYNLSLLEAVRSVRRYTGSSQCGVTVHDSTRERVSALEPWTLENEPVDGTLGLGLQILRVFE
jgi:hypothetical protein